MAIKSQKIVDKSVLSNLEKVIERYKFLDKVILEYEQMREVFSNYIIDVYEEYNVTKHKGVRLTNESLSPKLTIRELKNVFNNQKTNIIDNFVVDLDIEKSVESMMYIEGLPDPIIYSIQGMLKKIEGHRVKKLSVERE